MKQWHKTALKSVLKKFNLGVVRYGYLERLKQNEAAIHNVEFLKELDDRAIAPALRNLDKSESQVHQDLFVLSETNFKKGGYFVEFGAANGKKLSNTYLLEKEFGWNGILAEPACGWHKDLRKNRNAIVETRCVYSETGRQLDFVEADNGELSTISKFQSSDTFSDQRANGKTYKVETVSLLDLLKSHNAPNKIDYLSIDTEGSEFEILNSFDFNAYDISIITCEHNFTASRKRIHALLTSKGYVQKFETLSRFDDWYVRA